MLGTRAAWIASLVAGLALNAAGQASATEGFSGLVDVGGGHRVYLECRGSGSPTVILQSGFGNAGDVWSLAEADVPAVQPSLAAGNRVCSYDRPGSLRTNDFGGASPGRSDAVPMPRDPADVVTELHDLLAAAHVPGPYVLVGHSLGGPLNVLFARTYPDDVVGMVTVDSPAPSLRTLITPEQWSQFRNLQLSEDISPGYVTEAYDIGVLFDEIEASPPLRQMPLSVLVRGETEPAPDPLPPGMTVELLDALNRAAPQSQADFAGSVPGASIETVPGTTHYIQVQRPDVVVAAVRRVIDAQ